MCSEFGIRELRDIAKLIGSGRCETLTKQELLVLITQKLGALPSSPKYKVGAQIGNTGKDAKTFSVRDKDGNEYAMKTFKKNKSSDRIEQEANFQKRCASAGISPKIIDYDTQEKFIVMEKMEGHLYNIIETHQGLVSEKIQKQVLEIFKKLDKTGVFHGDANIMNYMYKGGKIYIIDFGFSKEIDDALIKKLETRTPNMDIMLLGFILKLKEMNCPPSSYSVLSKFVKKEKREELGI